MNNRLKELEELIDHYDKQYWEYGIEEVSDNIYESLKLELAELDSSNQRLTKINTIKINPTNVKIKHLDPMLSLAKYYKSDEILSWMNKVARDQNEKFILSPKWDGIAIKLYPNHLLVTRGDGIEGENISNKELLIEIWDSKINTARLGYNKELIFPCHRFLGKQIVQVYPLVSSYNDSERLGELVISKVKFDKYFKSGQILRDNGLKYETIRNVIAGIMNKDNTDKIPAGLFTFITYGCYTDILPLKDITSKILDDFQSFVKTLDYETDGIVIKLADKNYGKTLGSTAHHPKDSIAYKHANIGKQAICTFLELQSGKRKLTPVAYYEPTEIGGVICQKATLHNWKNVIDRDIQVGDILLIERAGGVTPKVIGSIPNKDKTKRIPLVPTTCPCCGSTIIYKDPELYCINKKCTDIIVQQLVYSIKALGIKNISESTINQLYTIFNIENIIDLYSLKQEDLEILDGWGKKSAENFISELTKIKNSEIADYKILTSLCIEGLGESTYKGLCSNYKIDNLLNLDINTLISLENIGDISARRFYNYIRSNLTYIKKLTTFFNIVNSLDIKSNISKFNKSICFSGKFSEKQSTYEQIAKDKGMSILSSVTKDLNILVVSDKSEINPSSKMKKAIKYGIRILTLDEFLHEFL